LQAMRRTENAAIAQFLGDRDPRFVLEAARAINDLPIEAAFPKLAALGDLKSSLAGFPSDDATPILRRVANAAFRLGGDANASLLASLVGNARLADSLRVEALEMLGEWAVKLRLAGPVRDQLVLFYEFDEKGARPVTRSGKPPRK